MKSVIDYVWFNNVSDNHTTAVLVEQFFGYISEFSYGIKFAVQTHDNSVFMAGMYCAVFNQSRNLFKTNLISNDLLDQLDATIMIY